MDERRFDVFLSYNSDDRPFVKTIAERLRAERLDPWWDRWALTPGGSWQEEIVGGLRESGACAVIVGQAGLGAWAREELMVAQDLAAKDRTFRIFMVLLPGAPTPTDPSLAFLSTRTWVDLRAGVAGRDGVQDLISAITGAPRVREAVASSVDRCPYRGLEAFTEEHAEFYFGREHDVAAAVERLANGRFLAVLGPSGSGKSSMLGAGLVPAIRRGALAGSETWAVCVFVPGPRPLNALAAQMTRQFSTAPMQETLDGLRADERSLDLAASVALADLPGSGRVLLVVDQFEEVFTLCNDDEERRSFLANLLYAATIPDGRVVVVLGMRADFYHRCAAHRELRVHVAAQQFLVGPMDALDLRRAIEEPAARVGVELEAGLVETILAEIHDLGTLPLLEDVLFEVWQRRRGTMLTLEGYVASGGMQGALAQRANAVYDGLSSTQQEIGRRVLLRLITPGDGAEVTRRRAQMAELLTGSDEDHYVEAVVAALADGRLVTTGMDDAGETVVDITHEALIRGWARLRTWIDENREAMIAQRHLTEAASEWDGRGRPLDDLYGGARLAYWDEHPHADLTELERVFVTESRDRRFRHEAARRKRWRLGVGGVMVGMATVAIVALMGLRGVAEQRDVARSRQLAAEATALLSTDPAQGLRLAIAAVHIDPTREAQRALRQAVVTPGSRTELLAGHEGIVTSVSFSPDGRRILSAGDDGTVRVWDWAGGHEPVVLRGHEGAVWGAAFSPDGRLVASAGEDGAVRVWEWAGGGEPTVLRGHQGAVWNASFSSDGRMVASTGDDGTVRVWDWVEGTEPSLLRGHAGSVYSAAFSGDGARIVSAGKDGTVRVWGRSLGVEETVLLGHEGTAWAAAFSPDGRLVVSAGNDGTVRVWDWSSGGEPTVLRGHDEAVATAAFSLDGRLVVSAGDDRSVRVWEWAGGSQPTVLRGTAGPVWAAGFQGGGRLVVSGGEDGEVRVWDWAGPTRPTALRGHHGPVYSAAVGPDGRRVLSAGTDGTVRIWDLAGVAQPIVLTGHEGMVWSAAFSPDGGRAVSSGSDGTVRVWDLASGGQPLVLRGHEGIVYAAAFSPDGRLVVSAGEDRTVRVWDLGGVHETVVLLGHLAAVWSAAFSPDGEHVVSAGEDGTARVWTWNGAPEPAVVLEGHEEAIYSAAFSSDGRRVATGGNDGMVRMWDWTGRSEPIVLKGHVGAVWGVATSADGRRLVSAGADGTVRIWDWASGEEPAVLLGPGSANAAALAPDEETVVAAENDGTVRVWDCSTCVSLDHLMTLAMSPIPR